MKFAAEHIDERYLSLTREQVARALGICEVHARCAPCPWRRAAALSRLTAPLGLPSRAVSTLATAPGRTNQICRRRLKQQKAPPLRSGGAICIQRGWRRDAGPGPENQRPLGFEARHLQHLGQHLKSGDRDVARRPPPIKR